MNHSAPKRLHEAAHILLHGKKSVFVDGVDDAENAMEAEANVWAARFLIPRAGWRRFVDRGAYDRPDVQGFAKNQGIAPGIVVGRLQHEGLLPWNQLNDLKERLQWEDHA